MADRTPPLTPPLPRPNLDSTPPSVWDRVSAWAAEHKAVVYTVAGVTLVATAAGVYYYTSDPSKPPSSGSTSSSSAKNKKKKEKKRAKKEAEEAAKKSESATGRFCASERE
jgi:mitochondrial import receptor subunit TOM70